MRQTKLIGVASLLLIASSISCFGGDPGPARELGVSLTQNNEILIGFSPCTNAPVCSVEMLRIKGKAFGDEDDQVLWKAATETPVELKTLTVGKAPQGLVEQVPLETLQPLSDTFAVQLETIRATGAVGISFSMKELRQGWFLTYRGEYVSEDKFFQQDACKK